MRSEKISKEVKGREIAKGEEKLLLPQQLERSAMGMESEFVLLIDNLEVPPERVFRDPQAFIRKPLMHRVGTSYHLPTGGAVYFDTGVIEVATPVIEIEPGCAARAGRSLWESILYIRGELDAWEDRSGHTARLTGFSSHYNISFDLQPREQGENCTLEKLAYLLVHLLPAPVMVLATNRRSTGVGVRPRGNRVEITVDFTPSAALMIATGALIAGIVREVMTWPTFELGVLDERGLPVIEGFSPIRHTSRKGWLAREDHYPHNPFTSDINDPIWFVNEAFYRNRQMARESISFRTIARSIFDYFKIPIQNICGPFTFPLIASVLYGRVPSLLDLPDRPPEYEDVGRLCTWDNLFPESVLDRSRYERVLARAISGRKLFLRGAYYKPVGLRGWAEVIFQRDSDQTRHVFSIDQLSRQLDSWDRKPA